MQQSDLFAHKTENEDHTAQPKKRNDKQGNIRQSNKRQLLNDPTEFYDGELLYIPRFLSSEKATKLFASLKENLAWEQSQIRVYGKWQTIPRLQAWYGDADAAYQYSGVMLEPLPWTKPLQQLREHVQSHCASPFNSVLANLYRDGQDCMGFHSDDEAELGEQPVIASFTLGGVRNFDLIHKTHAVKLRLPLQSGDLLVMKGDTQKYWQHGVARTKRIVEPRINLTFRQIYHRF